MPAGTRAWRAALDDAVRAPDTLEEFRRQDDGRVGSRDRLTALIEVHHRADPEVRAALLDWMTLLQPLDAPPWTIAETARAATPLPRHVHIDDLDQPRSAALRERLLDMLGSTHAGRRETAALALAKWPEPEARLPVLRAYLRGHVDIPIGVDLARALHTLDETELAHPHPVVRRTAAEGLVGMSEAAIPALRQAAAHARPDKRSLYTDVLDRLRNSSPSGNIPNPSGD